ncbi:MAG: prolipoprotein diacylglyceryl transferase [Cyclobacteriaceae bacterium]|nr:prolipoprotein diacylglyceryl transferase [Cyclobacteriaceae bacterium SS2]
MSWVEKLKNKWDLKSTWQVVVVLIVFSLTGTTVLFIKQPVLSFVYPYEPNTWFYVIYFLLIWPIYNILLLLYAFIFGQFTFFWNFEKRTFERIKNLVVRK